MFHSRGTVQSNTFVPVGTLNVSSEIRSRMRANVWRMPLPVMLRQIGNNSAANRCNSLPVETGSFRSNSSRILIALIEVRVRPVSLRDHLDGSGPSNAEGGIVPAHPPGCVRMIEFRHLIQ